MNSRTPYDPGTKIRELRWQQEPLADFINRHMNEFDGFYDIEEDFVSVSYTHLTLPTTPYV